MRAKEVLNLLNVSRETLCRYVREGKIKVSHKYSRTRYEYDDDSVYAFIGKVTDQKNRDIVTYSRVSTQNQKKQLEEQKRRIYDSCVARGLIVSKQYSDIKSGMNSDRKDFQEIIRRVIKGEMGLVVVENKDRLIRFGFDLLEQIFKFYDCKIMVLNDVLDNKTYEQELTDDLISIIHYFTMKNYSHQRKLNKLRKELEKQENGTKSNK